MPARDPRVEANHLPPLAWGVAVFLAAAAFLVGLHLHGLRRARIHAEDMVDLASRQATLRLDRCLRTRLYLADELGHDGASLPGGFADAALFRARASHVLGRFPGYQAINWIDAGGTIAIVVPEEGNRPALGRRLADHPQAAPWFERARATGEPALTPPLDLFQGGRGFAAYFPVHDGERFVGAVNAVFRIDRVVEDCLSGGLLDSFPIRLVDDDEELYRAAGWDRAVARLGARRSFVVGERTWTVELRPAAVLAGAWRPSRAVLAVGLVLAGILGLAVNRAKAAQRGAATAHDRLASLMATLPDLVLRVDDEGVVTEARGRGSLLPVRPGEVLEDTLPEAVAEAVRAGIEAGSCDRTVVLPGEPLRAYEVRVQPGVVPGCWLAVLSDASERERARRLAEELARAQRLEALGHLAGGVAHDFNNLLTAILGHVELATLSPGLPPEAREELDQVRSVADRGARLTRQLLAFSRRQVVEPVPVDLRELVADMTRMLRRLVRSNVALDVVDEGGEVVALLDRAQAEQVVMNLVVNAAEAMPDGGRVTVRVGRDGDRVRLVVEDDGPGVPEELRERIFEPFVTTKGSGTGLGLATVHRVAQAAGGEVRVGAAPGGGARFEVVLPAVAPVAEPEPAAADEDGGPLGGVRVLLVEDQPEVRAVLDTWLSRLGHEVRGAGEGADALRILDEGFEPDVLVTDLVMPGMGGLELAHRVRSRLPDLPVILASGYADTAVDPAELAALDASLLPKPYLPRQLAERIEAVLRSRRRR